MAIYHLRAKVIQRSRGQSAVKSAAYRHGERLRDERLKRTFSYKKPDVVASAIIAPDGAPAWVLDRQELWNRAERAEVRINSQPSREIEITIPREIAPQDRLAVVTGFIRDQFVSRGMVADIAIHVPVGADSQDQPHAHVMLTMRRLDASTKSGFAKKKAREWNEDPAIEDALRLAKDAFRKNETPELAAQIEALDARRNINVWRAAWTEHANRALAAADVVATIDHRSLKAQGIVREAQPHLGLARHVTPHIEKAYGFLKDRVANWLAVVKRNELYRAFAPYQRRDAVQFTKDVAAITAFKDGVMQHWRRRPRENAPPSPEVRHDR